jgi:heme exporter protein D
MTAMSLGPYTAFIVTSYLAATLVVAGLIGWISLDCARCIKRLRELDESGIARRSGRSMVEIT